MKHFRFYSLLILLVCNMLCYNPAEAKFILPNYRIQPTLQASENPIYTEQDVLEFKLSMDYKTLLKDRGEERSYHPAILSYTDSSGLVTVLNLKVMVRGNRRRDPRVCDFPPLMLNFSRKTSQHSIFNRVNKVKLVTHCLNDDYVIREYLVYKLYNVLTENSFRVRLCRITYEDLNNARKTEQQYAFMIEDDDEMAARNKSQDVPKEARITMKDTEEEATAIFTFFQYMIGNTDWSVPYRHNVELVTPDNYKTALPVPYDFDYAGIVHTPYATPPPELGISSVRQRLFRGYAFSENTYRKTINTFNALRTAIYGVYTLNPHLDKSYLKRTVKYLDEFYETINNPKDFERKIARVAQKNQENYVVVKGLE